jgi:hypothetical protein
MKTTTYGNYPWWMIAVCNSVGLVIYAIGIYLTGRLGIAWGAIYAACCVWMEWRLLSRSCRSCYYYGKRCGFGKGWVCSRIFSKSDEDFGARQISWWSVAPDFLVSLVPLGVGIFLLLWDFSWTVLFLAAALVLLGSVGTGYIRGHLACKYCKQRELGCPAERLFNNTKGT